MSKVLSIMPYFGGKARMADFIVERLNYNTSTFVTMFGGACRVLLNKPPHDVEIYNDYGSGVCAVMRVLSKPESAQEFINRLYYDTEYSREQYDKAKEIYDFCETDMEVQYANELKQLLIGKDIVSVISAGKFIENIWLESTSEEVENLNVSKSLISSREKLKKALVNDEIFKETFQKALSEWVTVRTWKEEGDLPRSRDMCENITISDMDLAIATYIVFTFGFSGTSQGFGEGKFASDEAYKKHILKLQPCAERMQGVTVTQLDAMSFFKQCLCLDDIEEPLFRSTMFFQLAVDPNVMMFCDPSYIDPRHEANLLRNEKMGIDIDVNNVESVSKAISEAWDGKKIPKNLGACYTRSFGYEEQEEFLQAMQYVQCKMMICNYDLELYNKYLNKETGWTKEVFHTTTSVGKVVSNNERIECIWYNY